MHTWEECQQVAEFLQGFSNPVRVKILCALRDGEKSVGQIAEMLNAKQSNISQQLQILMNKGHVVKRREERNIYYNVRCPGIFAVMENIMRLIQEKKAKP
ncbi:MAG: ArsR family transcriptional regulator [Peptococcaceae bacterium]|nr:MAG: ArsR family transcriptional regulator [Peptococcaceae bacterium]